MDTEIVSVDIPDDELLELALQAHELDITLNQHVNNILEKRIREAEDPISLAIEEIGR